MPACTAKRIVVEAFKRVLKLWISGRVLRVNSAVNHRLGFFVAGKRFLTGIVRIGNGIADTASLRSLILAVM